MNRSLSVIALALLVLPMPRAAAEPATHVTTTYYAITGTTAAELKSQMQSLGPHGHWAHTVWSVQWSDACRVSLTISFAYPRWTNQASAPTALRAQWNRMIGSLQAHEQGHAAHGRSAAREIEQSRCRDPRSVIDKWAQQDRTYDAQTDHGRSQGVALP